MVIKKACLDHAPLSKEKLLEEEHTYPITFFSATRWLVCHFINQVIPNMEQDNRPNKTPNQPSTSDDVRATITKANRASASLWMVLHAKVSMVRFWRLRKKSVLFVADNIMG